MHKGIKFTENDPAPEPSLKKIPFYNIAKKKLEIKKQKKNEEEDCPPVEQYYNVPNNSKAWLANYKEIAKEELKKITIEHYNFFKDFENIEYNVYIKNQKKLLKEFESKLYRWQLSLLEKNGIGLAKNNNNIEVQNKINYYQKIIEELKKKIEDAKRFRIYGQYWLEKKRKRDRDNKK